jgi:cytochrome c oxidase subunit 2
VDNPLVIPANKKVRFLITANDVIHSWWVPHFAVKKDAIPGFINESWVNVEEPGVYRGQCTELCGKDHGFMPVVVEVKSEADYAKWVADQKAMKLAMAGEASQEFSQHSLCWMPSAQWTGHPWCVPCNFGKYNRNRSD